MAGYSGTPRVSKLTAFCIWAGTLAGLANAEQVAWTADPSVGTNRIDITIDVDCTGNAICLLVDGYSSTRSPVVSGNGTGRLLEGGSLELSPDTLLVVPPVAAWTLDIESVTLDPIPLVGTPEISSARLFGTSGGPFAVPGLSFGPFATTTISETLNVGFRFDVTGINPPLPDQVVGPDPELLTGDFEMLDATRFEVRNLFWDVSDSQSMDLQPGTLTVTSTGVATLNLSGEILLLLAVRRDELAWTSIADASGYDVVRGDLQLLRGSSGDFTLATEACLADDRVETTLPYTVDPDPGTADWFLARRVTPAGNRSYDTPFDSQAAPRDLEIEASSASCP